MGVVKAEVEIGDKQGETILYAGAVGTTSLQIPTVADKSLDEVSIRCAIDQAANRRLEFSFDNVVFHRLSVGEGREEEPRGDIDKLYIRAAGSGVTTVNYEVAINYGRLPPTI